MKENKEENVTKDIDIKNDEDKMLYKEFLDGNKSVLDKLMIKYGDALISFVQKYINDYQIAEDISQEVFVYLLQHKEVYDFKYSLKTYLFMIAKSRTKNYFKQNRKYVLYDDSPENEALFSEIVDTEEDVFRKVENQRIRKILKSLKWEYKMAIYLIDFNELSYKEAGAILGKSVAQMKALIHNARNRIRFLLEEDEKKGVERSEINRRLHQQSI